MQQVKVSCCVEHLLLISLYSGILYPPSHWNIWRFYTRILTNVHTTSNPFKYNWYSCREHNDLGDLDLLILIQALLRLLISVTHLPTLQQFMAFSCYVFHDHLWHWNCLSVWWYVVDISDFKCILCFISSPAFGGIVVKNPPVSVGDARNVGSIPGLGRPLGVQKGNPLQYSCLENSMDKEAWRATVHGITKSWIRLSKWTHTHIHTSLLWILYPSISAPYLFSFAKKNSDVLRNCEFIEAEFRIISSLQYSENFLRFSQSEIL